MFIIVVYRLVMGEDVYNSSLEINDDVYNSSVEMGDD